MNTAKLIFGITLQVPIIGKQMHNALGSEKEILTQRYISDCFHSVLYI